MDTHARLSWLENFPELHGLEQHALEILAKNSPIVEAWPFKV